jgi:hypothetical protein
MYHPQICPILCSYETNLGQTMQNKLTTHLWYLVRSVPQCFARSKKNGMKTRKTLVWVVPFDCSCNRGPCFVSQGAVYLLPPQLVQAR